MDLKDDYSNYNSFVDKVKGLIAQRDYTRGALLLEEGLTQRPNDGGFQLFYLTVLLKLDRLEEAKSLLEKIISRFDDKKSYQVDALYYKGLYYFLQGELKNSMDCLKNCFELKISYFMKMLHDNDFELIRDSAEFKILITPVKEFTVNKYISLRLIFSKTLIYVCNELFLACQKIAISITPNKLKDYIDFNDIDDILDFYKSQKAETEGFSISPEEEFWGHCSNLQAWVENNYNTCILSKNISFPLLRELHDRGIPRFTPIFKKELLERIRTGGIKTLLYFIEDEDSYIRSLTEDDFFDNLLPYEEAEIMRNISSFIPLEYTLTTGLRDSREFFGLKDHKKMHFCIEHNHVIELEILLDKRYNNKQYHKALLEVRNLKFLKEIDIYSDGEYLRTYTILGNYS